MDTATPAPRANSNLNTSETQTNKVTKPDKKSRERSPAGTIDYPTKRRRGFGRQNCPRRDNRKSRFDADFIGDDERHNVALEEYYRMQGIVADDELPKLLHTLAIPLPSSFRIAKDSPFRQSIERSLHGEMTDLCKRIANECEVRKQNDRGGEEAPFKPLSSLKWYPDELAWTISAPRQMLRRDNVLAPLHRLMVSMNEIGAINRQECVSMIPPLLLDVQSGHSVIDMCAAPGSKTAQILESALSSSSGCKKHLSSPGIVIANDADLRRCWMLAHQLKRFGSAELIVTQHEAQHFPKFMTFDRVLCDVPCSGDGTLRKAPDIWRRWHSDMGIALHRLQRQIVERGVDILKPGGRLVYSTCSMNPVENEAIVAHVLRKYKGDVELIDCSDLLPGLIRRPGLTKWYIKDHSEKWKAKHQKAAEEAATAMGTENAESVADTNGNASSDPNMKSNFSTSDADADAVDKNTMKDDQVKNEENARSTSNENGAIPDQNKVNGVKTDAVSPIEVPFASGSDAKTDADRKPIDDVKGTNNAQEGLTNGANTKVEAEEIALETNTAEASTTENGNNVNGISDDLNGKQRLGPLVLPPEVPGWFTRFDEVPNRRRAKLVSSMFPPSKEELASDDFPLHRCMRLVPHDQDTGAFFVAVFHKKESSKMSRKQRREEGEAKERDEKEREEEDKQIQKWKDEEKLKNSSNNGSAEEKVGRTSVDPNNANGCNTENPEKFDKQEKVAEVQPAGNNSVENTATDNGNNPNDDTKPDEKEEPERPLNVKASKIFKDDALVEVRKISPETLNGIVDYLGLDREIGEYHLMTRGADGTTFKKVVAVSRTARTVIRHGIGSRDDAVQPNRQMVRIVNAGVRVLERTDRKDTVCRFRIIHDGVGILRAVMKKRVFEHPDMTRKRIVRLLKEKVVKIADDVDPIWKEVIAIGSGSAIILCEDEGVVVWIGKRGVDVVMAPDVIKALLMKFENED